MTTMTSLTCRQCNEPFFDDRPGNPRGRKPTFCSDECRAQNRRQSTREYNIGRVAERRIMEQCIDCPEVGTLDAVEGTDYCVAHAARRRARDLAKSFARYGITPEQYAALYIAQGGQCYICRAPEGDKRFSIDHDHACCSSNSSCGKCVRGLLCSDCNLALGLLKDDRAALRRALTYLDRPTLVI